MAKPLVLVTDIFDSAAIHLLSESAQVEWAQAPSPTDLGPDLARASCLMIRSRSKIDAHTLAQAPLLRCIVTSTSGFDHIDFIECQKRGIQVAYTPDANARSTAELTICLMLNLLRHVPRASKTIEQFHWRDQVPRGEQLSGLSLGVVGLGRVGRQVARLGQAFGMRILACDPYLTPQIFEEYQAEALAFSEILLAADILTLHTPLTRETRHLMNSATFRSMNSDSFLINCARGELVDEMELANALDEGLLRGAALDVFEKEPPARDSRLRKRPNLLMSPHLGAYTSEAMRQASQDAVRNVIEFFTKGQVLTPLPSHLAWFQA